jgi:hypothetical protein
VAAGADRGAVDQRNREEIRERELTEVRRGVALLGVIVQQAERRAIEVGGEALRLLEEHGARTRVVRHRDVGAETADEKGAEEDVLLVEVVIAPVRANPAVVDGVEQQRPGRRDGARAGGSPSALSSISPRAAASPSARAPIR